MDINLKDNIWIEGFESFEYLFDYMRNPGLSSHILNENILYKGKTSEIPEEVASKCCKYYDVCGGDIFYKEYSNITWSTYPYEIAKESIKSACDKEYCIIYKC